MECVLYEVRKADHREAKRRRSDARTDVTVLGNECSSLVVSMTKVVQVIETDLISKLRVFAGTVWTVGVAVVQYRNEGFSFSQIRINYWRAVIKQLLLNQDRFPLR